MTTIGFTCGTFDLLHPGHISLFKSCKMKCNRLIVGLHSDPSIERPEKNKPIQSLYERWLQLSSTKYVDDIIPYDTEKDLINILITTDIHLRFLGDDYNSNEFTGKNVCKNKGIGLIYFSREHGWSSSELRERIKNA
mgnify:FL=1|jgi:glycerol-3-phosphate cytidylyltransferase